MVSALFSVKHHHCGLCGAQRALYVLNLTRGEKPRLEPKQEGTHSGVCMDCWLDVIEVVESAQFGQCRNVSSKGNRCVQSRHHVPSPCWAGDDDGFFRPKGGIEKFGARGGVASARSQFLPPMETKNSDHLCAWCKVAPCKRPEAKFCSMHCSQQSQSHERRRPLTAHCQRCGKLFEPKRRTVKFCCRLTLEQRKANAKGFRDNWRRNHRDQVKSARGFYKALRKGAYVERLDIRSIYKRDKGLCGICRKTVSRADASLDHIQPLSRGGVHAAWNVRISHLACNLSRGNRGAAQLRMALS